MSDAIRFEDENGLLGHVPVENVCLACGAAWEQMDAAYEPCPRQDYVREFVAEYNLLPLAPSDWP